jgi:hypothetical protein
MDYDFDYYDGKDIVYPTKPTKPRMSSAPTAAEARSYADELEAYTDAMVRYKEDCAVYGQEAGDRLKELQDRLRDDYDLAQAQFDLLWGKAYEDGHGSGLYDVVYHFDELYDVASQFAALEKG